MIIDRMKPVVIVTGGRAEHNPNKNRLTFQVFFSKPSGAKSDSGDIILINGEVPRVIVKAPEVELVETERR